MNNDAPSSAAGPRVGISACLLGEAVRYDGRHKHHAKLRAALDRVFAWVSICPEVEAGLGVPREPMHLEGSPDAPQLIVTATREDLTAGVRSLVELQARKLVAAGIDGCILKSRSPSCGIRDVPVLPAASEAAGDGATIDEATTSEQPRPGRGLFADALARIEPTLPVASEDELENPVVRRRFVERVTSRWRGRAARSADR